MMKFFFEKKRFHFFENLLHKNENAENMPVVTGRLVTHNSIKNTFFLHDFDEDNVMEPKLNTWNDSSAFI